MTQRRTEPEMVRWLHAKADRTGTPLAGNFELTSRCNFSCPMCYIHGAREDAQLAARELTAKQWITLAEQARDSGMLFALLTGGEPFVRKDFFEIYEAMCAMGLMMSINTNGSMLSGEIRRRLLENPPQRMNISLYGGCPETYRNMCRRDAFAQVVENLRALRAAGISIRLNVSLTPYNAQDLEKIHEISKQLDVPVKATSYMFPKVRIDGLGADCSDRLNEREAAECDARWDKLRLTPELFRLRAKAMQDMTLVEPDECMMESEEGISCRAGRTSFWLTWDGRMLPCGMMPGNGVRPMEIGFREAWLQTREAAEQIRMPKACGSCPKRRFCGVCAAVCAAETGSFTQVPEFLCRKCDEMSRAMWAACQEEKEP